ncbi:hypothetical protein CMO91_04200 [Candidatus Woesearchaeota archaeon]|nr:hypothetical protein [Candidatus Woesearchaeota archaeon]
MGSVTLIIPTLNEGKNIGKLLALVDMPVIVCDDGSTDNTREVTEKYKSCTFLDRKDAKVHGLTASVVDGINRATTPYVIVMDGDLQHPPEALPAFVEKLKTADIVVGVREKVASSWPWYRRLISWGGTTLAKIILRLRGTSVVDPMSGFFGVSRELFLSTNQNKYVGPGYKVLLDLLKQVKSNVATVPYTFGARAEGMSKLRFKHWLWFLKSLVR